MPQIFMTDGGNLTLALSVLPICLFLHIDAVCVILGSSHLVTNVCAMLCSILDNWALVAWLF